MAGLKSDLHGYRSERRLQLRVFSVGMLGWLGDAPLTAEHKRGWVEMVPLACLTRRPVQLTGWKQHHHIFFSFAKTS